MSFLHWGILNAFHLVLVLWSVTNRTKLSLCVVFFWRAGSILSIYLHKVDLIYVLVVLMYTSIDSITLYKLLYYSMQMCIAWFLLFLTTMRGCSKGLRPVLRGNSWLRRHGNILMKLFFIRKLFQSIRIIHWRNS